MLTRENKVEIIGTLDSINVVKDTTASVGPYIRGSMVISVTSPKQMNIPLNFFAAATTKEGKPRKLYGQLETLQQGSRVNITAQIQDNKFWDQARGQLVKTKRLSVVFINNVRAGDEDKAVFTYSGFINKPLRETFNKEGEPVGYEIDIAQANYLNSRAEIVTFNVDPKDTRSVNYITSEYTSGKTVKISGDLDYDIKTETVEEEVDFGKPQIRTFQRNISNLMITGGAYVEEGIYDKSDIDMLLAGDLADDNEVIEKAKNQEKSGDVVNTKKPMVSTSNTNQSLL